MKTAHDQVNRREFLQAALAATATCGAFRPQRILGAAEDTFPPVRQLTRGPKFHWFGYYDKLQFSPDNRFVLSNKVSFEHRSPTADDVIEVGMVDLHEKDKWIPLGQSKAWCWQQGCMLQWIPGTESKVIWNDREKDRFVSHILDVKTGEKHTLPAPIYALSPNGKEAVSCDFARVADCRPGYGYAGIRDRFFDDMAPEGSGVTHVNLETGAEKLIVTHKQLATTGEVIREPPRLQAPRLPPAVQSGWETLHPASPLDAAEGRSPHAPHHRGHGRQRPAHRHPERLRLALHLARCHAHPVAGQGLARQRRAGAISCSRTRTPASSRRSAKACSMPAATSPTCGTTSGFSTTPIPKARSVSRRRTSTTSRRTAASTSATSICRREYNGEWRVDTHPRLSRDERWFASTRRTPAKAGNFTSSTSARWVEESAAKPGLRQTWAIHEDSLQPQGGGAARQIGAAAPGVELRILICVSSWLSRFCKEFQGSQDRTLFGSGGSGKGEGNSGMAGGGKCGKWGGVLARTEFQAVRGGHGLEIVVRRLELGGEGAVVKCRR